MGGYECWDGGGVWCGANVGNIYLLMIIPTVKGLFLSSSSSSSSTFDLVNLPMSHLNC